MISKEGKYLFHDLSLNFCNNFSETERQKNSTRHRQRDAATRNEAASSKRSGTVEAKGKGTWPNDTRHFDETASALAVPSHTHSNTAFPHQNNPHN